MGAELTPPEVTDNLSYNHNARPFTPLEEMTAQEEKVICFKYLYIYIYASPVTCFQKVMFHFFHGYIIFSEHYGDQRIRGQNSHLGFILDTVT